MPRTFCHSKALPLRVIVNGDGGKWGAFFRSQFAEQIHHIPDQILPHFLPQKHSLRGAKTSKWRDKT